MLESVTADSIFVEIMMDETSPLAFFLVEGADENSVFFGHVSSGVVLMVCGGKTNVLSAVRLAESQGYDNVYGLVDSDFDRLRGLDASYPAHVVATGSYDLIADLVLSSPDVLRRSLSAHAAMGVELVETAVGDTIDIAVYDITSKLAGARLATMREGYPLVFRGYNFLPVVDGGYRPLGLADFVANAACRDPHFVVDATVMEILDVSFSEVDGARHFSGGHDLVGASIALLRKAGSQVSLNALSGTLIAVASCGVLASLACLQELTDLARTDSGVELLDCLAA